jgi:hypothetical protein
MSRTDHHGVIQPYRESPSGRHSNGVSLANRGAGEHRYRLEEDKPTMRKRARRLTKRATKREVDSET